MVVDRFVEWCENNKLLLNVSKTKELVVDYRRKKMVTQPVYIQGEEVMVVTDDKYLGVHLNNRLDQMTNSKACLQEGYEQTLLLEETRMLQCICQTAGDLLPVCGWKSNILCCNHLREQHPSWRYK